MALTKGPWVAFAGFTSTPRTVNPGTSSRAISRRGLHVNDNLLARSDLGGGASLRHIRANKKDKEFVARPQGGGIQPWRPTKKQREDVETMAGYGIPQVDIARLRQKRPARSFCASPAGHPRPRKRAVIACC